MKVKAICSAVLAVFLLFVTAGCGGDEKRITASSVGSAPSASSDVYSDVSSDVFTASVTESSTDAENETHIVSEPESGQADKVLQTEVEPISLPGISDEALRRILSLSGELKPWGQGLTKDELNRPVGSLNAQNRYGQYGARYIMDNTKSIYLTFDEGYENGYTPAILDTLKEKNVKAVFFVTMSYVKKCPELVRRMIDEGHVVGNHSNKHFSYPTEGLSTVYDDFISMHNYMEENFNYQMRLFRFPKGEFSEQTLALVQELGYESVFWSYAYHDWDPENQMDAEQAFQKIVTNAHPGALYLLHAVSKTNAEILGRVIDRFIADGYTVDAYPVG